MARSGEGVGGYRPNVGLWPPPAEEVSAAHSHRIPACDFVRASFAELSNGVCAAPSARMACGPWLLQLLQDAPRRPTRNPHIEGISFYSLEPQVNSRRGARCFGFIAGFYFTIMRDIL